MPGITSVSHAYRVAIIAALCLKTSWAQEVPAPAAHAFHLQQGRLSATFRDNRLSPGRLSGIDSLLHIQSAPDFDAFDPEQTNASAGLNFEHIISGHRNPHNKFSPRQGRYTLHPVVPERSVAFVRRAEDSPWKMDSRLTCTVVKPHYVDFEFQCIPRDASLFGSRRYAILFFANYMNDVENVALHFRGQTSANSGESWVAATAPKSHPDWNRGGNYRSLPASDLAYDSDTEFRLNSWSYDWPRFTQPFYFGRAANNMTMVLMFDRMHSNRDEIRFSLYKFKLPRRMRPAWDFQYVIRQIQTDQTYGFRGRLAWKPFVNPDDCLQEYHRWAAGLEQQTTRERQKRVQELRDTGATVFLRNGRVNEVSANRTKITDAQITLLANFKQMTDLSLEATRVSDAGAVHLRHLQQLEWLNLYRTQIGNQGLRSIGQLRRLTHLPIGATRVTDAGLTHLRNLKQLVYLGLRGNPITDAGVMQLSELRQLEGLHLGETRVGDKGIRILGTLRRLQKLWLDQTSVSDRAIDTLVQFQDLRELHIRQTRITAMGKARLKRQLPKCQLFDSAD